MSDLQHLLASGLSLHQSGRLGEAAKVYEKVLIEDPTNADALNLLGLIFQAVGELDTAISLLSQAGDAAPDYFAPFVNLGNVLQQAGRLDEALNAFRRAILLNPEAAPAYNNLASCLNALDRYQEAMEACVQGLAYDAGLADLSVNMANALLGLGRPEEALKTLEKAMPHCGENANAWFNLGLTHMDMGRYEDARDALDKAIALEAGNDAAHYNLALALLQLDAFDDAIAAFERAIALREDYVDAYCNLASAHQSKGDSAGAIECLRTALTFEPESVDLHWNLSLALLQAGQYREGWKEYEWRWRTPTFAAFKRDFSTPQWDGGPLGGRTIVLLAEQGFGDAIQFIRYATMVRERGGRVIIECRAGLERLFSGIDGVAQVVTLGDPLPPFDVQVPLMSLPHLLGTTLETVPAKIPYLAPPRESAVPREPFETSALKVGLVWAGSPTRRDNHKRSFPPALLQGLLNVPGTTFYSLQVGPFRGDLKTLSEASPGASEIIDLAGFLQDFADTAAALDALDLLISVDTGVLHLAGALGKEAWALMAQPTGFLWMDGRADSLWYPTTRLFRQTEPGDWAGVAAAVEAALRQKAG